MEKQSRHSLLVRAADSWQKSLNTGRSSRRIFFSRVTLCVPTLVWCPFHPCVTAVACKRPRHSAKSADGRLYLNAHTPLTRQELEWADQASVQAQCGNLSGNEFTHNLSESIRPQSSQPAEPPWVDHGIKSRISVRKLISTSKKKKKCRQGMNGQTFSRNPRKQGESHQQCSRCVCTHKKLKHKHKTGHRESDTDDGCGHFLKESQ